MLPLVSFIVLRILPKLLRYVLLPGRVILSFLFFFKADVTIHVPLHCHTRSGIGLSSSGKFNLYIILGRINIFMGFPGVLDGKEFACSVGDLGSTPGLGRSPEGRHGNHSSILAWRLRMDRRTWQATVHGVAKSWTQLSD